MYKIRRTLLWWNRPIFIILTLIGVLAGTAILAQRTADLRSAEAESMSGMKSALAVRLGKSTGNIGELQMRLSNDHAVVEKAASSVVPEFKRDGYSDQEAVSGLAWTWYQLRVGPNAVPLTSALSLGIIQQKAAKQGRLIVVSNPSGAAISVDSIEWPTPTNAQGFADVGSRHVLVARDGLEPVEGTCQVGRDQTATFSAMLKKKGSKAACTMK
jgi:hypothetical protein